MIAGKGVMGYSDGDNTKALFKFLSESHLTTQELYTLWIPAITGCENWSINKAITIKEPQKRGLLNL